MVAARRKSVPVEITPGMTYGEAALAKANSTDNFKGAAVTLRELGEHIHFSAEHMRRLMLRGSTLLSEDCNDALCRALRLDPKMMWAKNLRERSIHKSQLISKTFNDGGPEGYEVELLMLVSKLGEEERVRILKIAQGLYEQSKLSTPVSTK